MTPTTQPCKASAALRPARHWACCVGPAAALGCCNPCAAALQGQPLLTHRASIRCLVLPAVHAAPAEVKRMVAAAKGGLLGQLTEVLRRGELAADSEVMERVALLEPALVRV